MTAISNWNNDRYPRLSHKCTDQDYPNLASARRFWSLVDGVTWDARKNCSQGSILRDYSAGLRTAKDWAYFSPELIKEKFPNTATRIDEHALRGWATYSRWNWEGYARMEKQFAIARRDLAAHYQDLLGIPENEVEELAGRALLARIFGIKGASYKGSLSDQVLSGAPLAAIQQDLISSAKGIFARSPAPSFTGNNEPLLMIAIPRPEVVSLLLEHGADPNVTNDFGKTPLMAAAQYDDLQSVNALLNAGAQINAKSSHPTKVPHNDIFKPEDQRCNAYNIKFGERTALMYAAANASRPVIEALLKAGADPTMVDSEGNNAEDYLSGRGPTARNPHLSYEERREIAALFEKSVTAEQRAFARREELKTQLLAAAADGTVSSLRKLIDQGADLKAHDSHGKSALHLAVESGNSDAVDFLLAKGMDPNAHLQKTLSPLATAVKAGHTEVVRRLIAGGADVHKKHDYGYARQISLLRLIGWSDVYRPEIALVLIDAGTAKNLNEKQIGTLFRHTLERGSPKVFDRLVHEGFMVRNKAEFLGKAVSLASKPWGHQGNLNFIRSAIAAGFDVNARLGKHSGKRALHLARRPDVVAILVSLGADLEATDDGDVTPLFTALGHPLVFHALLAAGSDAGKVVGHKGWSKLHAVAAGPNARIETVQKLLAEGVDVDVRD